MWEYMTERRAGGRKRGLFGKKKRKKKYHPKNNATKVGSRAGDQSVKHDMAPASNVIKL